jgi:predicted nucleotidyltransferase
LVGSEAEKESPGFTNKYAAQAPLPVLKSLLRYPVCGVMAHWLFQSMHYLDRTELFFKIGFEVLATFVFYLILGVKLNHVPAFLLAIFLAHTVNFLFNAQLFVVLKHYGLVSHSESEFSAYTDELRTRILEEPSLRCAAVYGSCVRGAWRPSSDLDVLLFREKGWVCGLRACVFLLRERTRALFSGFPLDMYVLDDDSYLSRLSPEEKPIILVKK